MPMFVKARSFRIPSRLLANHYSYYSQEILTHNFAEILLRITTLEQCGGKHRHLRNIFQSSWHTGNSIKIAPNSYVLDAGDLDDVVNAIGCVFHRGISQRCMTMVLL